MDDFWWANENNKIHEMPKCEWGHACIYAKHDGKSWEYAYVEWRSGRAYLFGLYRSGKSIPLYDQYTVHPKLRSGCLE